MKSKHYWMVGPDGLSDQSDPYPTVAMVRFVLRYQHQGYYRTVEGDRIPFDQIQNHCRIDDHLYDYHV